MTTATATLTGAYAIDPGHSRMGFVARHAMVTKVRGQFTTFDGGGYFDADDPTRTTIELTIQADSIETANADRDAHLRSSDFFDMDNHPTLTFKSTAVERVDDIHRVTGDLTLRGVTRPVTIDFEFTGAAVDPYGNQRIGFEGRTSVNRSDWGLNWNAPLDAGGVLVSEKVTLEFDVSAIRTEAA